MVMLAALLATAVGVTLGLLGGGGSILMVPVLVDVLHVEPQQAIAISLLFVASTSATALAAHARRGSLAWTRGIEMGISGMAGAYAGGSAAHLLPSGLLLAAFAVLMLVTAAAMLRGRSGAPAPQHPSAARPERARIVAAGLGVGTVAGLVGAGGGFLVVPALVLFARLPMPRAVATSLLVIALQSFAGLAGHIGHVQMDWAFAGVVCAAGAAGSLVGARVGRHVSADVLRRAFGWLVLVIGIVFLAARIPLSQLRLVALESPASVLLVGVTLVFCVGFAIRVHLRRHPTSKRVNHA